MILKVLAWDRHKNMACLKWLMGSFFDNWFTDKYPPHSSSVWKAMYNLQGVEKDRYQTDTIKNWFKL